MTTTRGTTSNRTWAGAVALALTVAAGSATAARPATGTRNRTIKNNGPELNGTRLDDDPRSARAVEYLDLSRGVTLADGKVVRGLKLVGTIIEGKGAPSSWPGTLLDGVATDGKPLRVRIDAAAAAADPDPATPANEAAGLTTYTMSVQLGTRDKKGAWTGEGDFRPLCGGKPVMPLAGRWDYFAGNARDSRRLSSKPTEVTLSCADAAIGKCAASMGYRPWEKPRGGASLDALHQACVRAVRADYCGNGESHTVAGNQVNIYDSAGVQKDTAEWKMEASWNESGARCVSSTRLPSMPGSDGKDTVQGYIGRVCPKVWRETPCAPEKGKAVLYTEHQ